MGKLNDVPIKDLVKQCRENIYSEGIPKRVIIIPNGSDVPSKLIKALMEENIWATVDCSKNPPKPEEYISVYGDCYVFDFLI